MYIKVTILRFLFLIFFHVPEVPADAVSACGRQSDGKVANRPEAHHALMCLRWSEPSRTLQGVAVSQAGLVRREFEGHWSAARTSRRKFDIHRKKVWSVTAGVGQGGTCCHKVPGSKEGREDAPTADARHTSYRVSSRYIL